ncbi:MAG: MFS transporter [Luteolibacter sp.]|jgi:acyl-[acyl-carrier-protein]-phospholipid O-acyltransferase/long-chain-fatty-acid--[acyl-carrier-protein] ligase|nr:MFS transporter [Luteolibacter sp.]
MSDESPAFEPTRRQWTGYWSMIVQQTQNAFNDKMAQFILIPLGGAVGLAVESIAGLMIALPFVLFAPLAGWLSDRFSKRDVMFGSAVLQLLVLLWICGSVWLKNLPIALIGFFMLAVQSAFFSPAKIGINKELVGSRHLGFATSIQQMTAMLAMLVGQIIAGWLFDRRYHALGAGPGTAWQAALGPLVVLTAFSVPALVMAWIVPRVPAQGGGKFTAGLAVSHFVNLCELWHHPPLRRVSFGVAFFWGFAAFINLWSVKLAKVITGGGEGFGTLSSMFMAAASLGMAAGFGFSSYLLRRRIELGWVPLAGVAMTLASLALALVPPGSAAEFLLLLKSNPLAYACASPRETVFLTILGLLAFSGAVFLAPLNAWLQDHYPAAKRGEMQAAVNLQDCLAGIISVAVIAIFETSAGAFGIALPTGFRFQMIFIALACFVASILIIRVLPADFIRVIGVALMRMIYRIRTARPERLPAKGGALLLPNHVTYMDAFFMSAASPRPIRFVMDEAFMAQRAIRIFTSIFSTVTIRREHPLEAIREIIQALQNGDVVCLFPEGQITRTGTLCALQRGFEVIAKKAGQPLIPVWCDGTWGSIFSYERNCFFRKIPHRMEHGITMAFGKAIAPKCANQPSVRDGMMAASSDAISRRFASRRWSRRLPGAKNPAASAFRAADASCRRMMWINGYQLGMINALPRRRTFHIMKDDPLLTELPSLTAAFPVLFHAELRIRETFEGDDDAVWVGGDVLRHALEFSQITASHVVFYDFGSRALSPIERAGLCHYPGLVAGDRVISMSMPNPPPSAQGIESQLGHKPGSWGKLLPGWHLERCEESGTLRVHGPAAPAGGLPLPIACSLDAEGFLVS